MYICCDDVVTECGNTVAACYGARSQCHVGIHVSYTNSLNSATTTGYVTSYLYWDLLSVGLHRLELGDKPALARCPRDGCLTITNKTKCRRKFMENRYHVPVVRQPVKVIQPSPRRSAGSKSAKASDKLFSGSAKILCECTWKCMYMYNHVYVHVHRHVHVRVLFVSEPIDDMYNQ